MRQEQSALCQKLHFTPEDIRDIGRIETSIAQSGHASAWNKIKQVFHALQPAYTPDVGRWGGLRSVAREQLFIRQEGKCDYCACTLIPYGDPRYSPETWAKDTLNAYRDHPWWEWDATYVTAYEEYNRWQSTDCKRRATVDHRIPCSRGGNDGIDNLALACWGCNNRKRERTVSEFLAMPNDPISWLHMPLGHIYRAIAYEGRGYTYFAEA